MINPRNPLLNNRTFIQVGSDEMRCGADNLDTTLVGLVVRLGTLEGGQEAVVDVDDAARHSFAEGRGEDLHVAGENNEFDIVLFDEGEDLGFLLGFGVFCDGEVVEFDAV